jgi:hypothetical protein
VCEEKPVAIRLLQVFVYMEQPDCINLILIIIQLKKKSASAFLNTCIKYKKYAPEYRAEELTCIHAGLFKWIK